MKVRIFLHGNAQWVGELDSLDDLIDDIQKGRKAGKLVCLKAKNEIPVFINPDHVLSVSEYIPPVEASQQEPTTLDVS